MAGPRVTMEVGDDGIALITMHNPPVNALALPVVWGLKEKFAEAMKRDDVKALVLTGSGGKFCGGFDINVFVDIHKTGDISIFPDDTTDLLVNAIGYAKKPAVAAIEGLALGGGLEVAMACHARIATPRTKLGLPEAALGVIPAFGGTQLLPRLVGLPKAIEMLLLAKSIMSEEGKLLGLVDAITSSADLVKESRKWAIDIAERRKPWLQTLQRTDRLESLSEARYVFQMARQQVMQAARNMPQLQACLDSVEEGVIHGAYRGVIKEDKMFKELILSNTSKGLIHIFFAQRTASKIPGVTDFGKPRPVKKVAILGGGLMGSGIATALILSNIHVVLKSSNSSSLLKGIKAIEANIQDMISKKKLARDKAEKALLMLQGILDYTELRDVDMVIETVIEDVALKQKIFSEIEKICPPHCILATNTSTIDLNLIAEKTGSQDRVVGAHFASPAHMMPLLEIVRTDKTSPQVILDLITFGKIIKKVPIVVGNSTGFAVNRAIFTYVQGAHFLLHLGVDPFRIDQLISKFGLPMGPFQLQDLAGYRTALASGKIYVSAFHGRTFKSPLVELLIKNGRNGKNNEKGYYIYEKGSKATPDLTVLDIIDQSRRIANVMPGGKPLTVSDEDIIEMILFPVVNESCRVLDEGIAIRASDLDVASVFGMGFPPYRGGILFWADTIGADIIYRSLEKWSKTYGEFFKPSRFLKERATGRGPLSAPTSASPLSNSRL